MAGGLGTSEPIMTLVFVLMLPRGASLPGRLLRSSATGRGAEIAPGEPGMAVTSESWPSQNTRTTDVDRFPGFAKVSLIWDVLNQFGKSIERKHLVRGAGPPLFALQATLAVPEC